MIRALYIYYLILIYSSMLYSKTLLQRYLSINEDLATIANQLTLKSSEVEHTIQRDIPSWVVIGKVTSVKDHDNADKLVVCLVDCWSRWEYQICTWATNVEEGSYVPVALPGTHLPALNLTIQERTMRGEESNWMICSKEELSIQDDLGLHGIWVLQSAKFRSTRANADNNCAGDFSDIKEKDLGVPLIDKYPRLEWWIIDVENKTITHRPDMFWHIWLVFELQAMFPKSLWFNKVEDLKEKLTVPHILQLIEHAETSTFPVSIESSKVLTYTTLVLSDIHVQPTDFFTKLTLLDCWAESKSNRVDFSNIFMYSTGQPIHIFDKDKIAWWITVRQAHKDEPFVDLFGKEHTLHSDDIVIADDEKILALAGVIWAQWPGVDKETTNIIIEIANFDPVSVRKTAMRLWIRTEASIRYEKSINPLFTLACLELLFDHLKYYKASLGDREIQWATNRINEESNVHITESIDVDWRYVYKTIYGQSEIDDTILQEFIAQGSTILSNLWYVVRTTFLQAPSRRAPEDITCDEDIVEDVARIIWYDTLDNTIPDSAWEYQWEHHQFTWFTLHRRLIEDYFVGRAQANQIETYPRIDQSLINKWLVTSDNLLSCKNPLNPDKTSLRGTILRSLLDAVVKNNAFYESFTLFDIGKIWNASREEKEHTAIWFAVCAKSFSELEHPLRYGKSHIQWVLETLNAKGKLTYNSTDVEHFHPKQQASIHLNWKKIWSLQTIHPLLLQQLKIDPKLVVTVWEIDYTCLKEFIITDNSLKKSYETLSDQIVWRDLSFVIDTNETFDTVTNALLSCKEITDVELFDVYQGPTIPEWTKSCAVRIKIPAQNIKKAETSKKSTSITSEMINTVLDKAIQAAEKAWATLRSQ